MTNTRMRKDETALEHILIIIIIAVVLIFSYITISHDDTIRRYEILCENNKVSVRRNKPSISKLGESEYEVSFIGDNGKVGKAGFDTDDITISSDGNYVLYNETYDVLEDIYLTKDVYQSLYLSEY